MNMERPIFSSRQPLFKDGLNISRLAKSPANILTALIFLLGIFVTVVRFTKGLGGVTNLSNYNPWGLWISFDLLCGVVLAAGGYVATSAYYLFGLKDLRTVVRPAVTTAFLGYFFVVVALHYDVGQPWRLVYPIFLSHGTSSVLFEVGMCVFFYLLVLTTEWSVYACEWLGWKGVRAFVHKLVIPLTMLGVILSTMHQSSLGSLYLIAPSKMHPLWYSTFLPVFFFISSIYAGMSMIVFEGAIAGKAMRQQMDGAHLRDRDTIVFAFGKGASLVMLGYLFIRYCGIFMNNGWDYLGTSYGALFLLETLGLVALPAAVYAVGVRKREAGLIKKASALAILGVIVNRFDVSLVAFNYNLPAADKYVPSWMEVAISLFIVALLVTAYRLICTVMPVLREHPEYGHDD
ncbi:MAG: polysulfide reductase NrfD [Gracilibacteraceae bacterium]|jgi:Ni/Fe-hydrogenase subunit HybB-like protein|nr:polysulfide reductase NrfD [Gracilibacteraceae bacterium]